MQFIISDLFIGIVLAAVMYGVNAWSITMEDGVRQNKGILLKNKFVKRILWLPDECCCWLGCLDTALVTAVWPDVAADWRWQASCCHQRDNGSRAGGREAGAAPAGQVGRTLTIKAVLDLHLRVNTSVLI